ncbi:hypothetical protein ACFPN0_31560 [Kitasatospora cinereorecta]
MTTALARLPPSAPGAATSGPPGRSSRTGPVDPEATRAVPAQDGPAAPAAVDGGPRGATPEA